ncbi:MAG: DUF4270 family protein [Ginsengibacter sp.]
MFKSQYKTAVTGILILFLFGLGCTKIDTTPLGQGLIPAVDNIHTFETTFDVVAKNFDDFSTCDSVQRGDLHALGIISNDPYFGKTNAAIYLELKPKAYPFAFPDHDTDSLFIDSAVLVLQYSHSFGDTNLVQKVQVYQITHNFRPDSLYSTCSIFDHQLFSLGEKSYLPSRLRDSIHAFREDAANQLRIPIKNSLIQGFINNPNMLVSDSAFKESFKGFAIVPDETAGGQALNYFSLTSTNTRLSIYLRSSKANVKDTSVINFPMTDFLSGEANSIVRTRGNSEITQHLSQPPAGDSVVYIQTSPGSYAQLTIPGLSGLSNRVIHRAELIIDQLYSPNTMDNYFTAPQMLYLDTKDTSTNGAYVPIPCDFSMNELQTGFNYLGGAPKQVDDGMGHPIKRYVFNISRYVQSIVTKGSNNDVLRLSAPYYIHNKATYADRCNQLISPFNLGMNLIGDGRVKLNGTNSTSTRMRLRIVYSTL